MSAYKNHVSGGRTPHTLPPEKAVRQLRPGERPPPWRSFTGPVEMTADQCPNVGSEARRSSFAASAIGANGHAPCNFFDRDSLRPATEARADMAKPAVRYRQMKAGPPTRTGPVRERH